MTKICSKCQNEKRRSEFGKRTANKDGLDYWCVKCRQEYRRDYYQANKESLIKQTTAHHLKAAEENKMKYCAFLSEHPCCDCGETNILVLEPDHLRDKKYNLSELILRAYAWTTVEIELAKCEIVCRNCHSIREAGRQNGNYKIRYLANHLATVY